MDLIKWLLDGQVSIQYQTHRDLLNIERNELKKRITTEGWGKQLLELQQEDGHWGGGYYHYKWINTHYTLLELRRLEMNKNPQIEKSIDTIIENFKTDDGGIMPNPQVWKFSDVCLNGMLLFVFCYYDVDQVKIESVIDFILSQQLPDGGFNCNYNYEKYGAKHSSLHSTISLIEGMNEYINQGYKYRVEELIKAREEAIEFILMHRLFKSDKTGLIIKKSFTMLSYPPRWKYDILRCLEAFRAADIQYDERMQDAFDVIMKKRKEDGTWPVQNKHQGKVHFDMEQMGKSSRWNTLRVLRVLKHFFPKEDFTS